MIKTRFSAVLLGAALSLGACSFTNEALLPSLGIDGSSGGTPPTGQTQGQTSGQPPATPAAQGVQTASVAPGGATGTFVGQKVVDLRSELGRLQTGVSIETDSLQQLRNQSGQNALAYHQAVADIVTKLQVGTTPGNPILTQQWNTAQSQFEAVNSDLDKMNVLANEMAGNVNFANYLLDAIHASFGISGAVDEDHRQLKQLEVETQTATQQLQQLLTELSGDIARQSAFVTGERTNLAALAVAINSGQAIGPGLASRGAFVPPVGPEALPGSGASTNRPLVTIRFDTPNVSYDTPLYQAVRAALDRRPTATFDLVALPAGATSAADQASNASRARGYANNVMRSLVSMGLPAERISVRTAGGQTSPVDVVLLYVR